MQFEILKSVPVFKGRAFSVRQDQVRLPNGVISNLDIVDHTHAVVLVPVDEQGNLKMVRQYRHAVEGWLLELPAGTLEENEDPAECAQRELREEIGMGATRFEELGAFFLAPGYSTEKLTIYLASGLYPDPLPGDEDEFLEVVTIPKEKVLQEAGAGRIQDAKTLAALLLAGKYIASDPSTSGGS